MAIMKDAVTTFRALADNTRWRIVRLVMEDALCVCELAAILDMPQSSVSSHVQVIRKAGLLESEKCEKWTYFRVDPAYLKLLEKVDIFFSETQDPVHLQDTEKATRMLEKRIASCCPGPKNLKPRKLRTRTTKNKHHETIRT